MKRPTSLPIVMLYPGRAIDGMKTLERERAVYATRPQRVILASLSLPDATFLGTPSEAWERSQA